MKRGANTLEDDSDKASEFVGAAEQGHDNIVNQLLSGYKFSGKTISLALDRAAENGHGYIVTCLLDNAGNEISALYEGSALSRAAENGHGYIVKCLLDNAENEISTNDKERALNRAAINGHANIVKCLLDNAGNKISAEDKGTALYLAAAEGHDKCVKCLLDNAGNEISHCGDALVSAAENGYFIVVQQLLDFDTKGTKFRLKEKKMAIDFSANKSHFDIVNKLLIKYPELRNDGLGKKLWATFEMIQVKTLAQTLAYYRNETNIKLPSDLVKRIAHFTPGFQALQSSEERVHHEEHIAQMYTNFLNKNHI